MTRYYLRLLCIVTLNFIGITTAALIIGSDMPAEDELLVTASFNSGDLNIYRLSLNRRIVRPLTRSPANDFLPAWSPDGTQIAFVSDREGLYSIYIADAQGSHAHRMTDATTNEYNPVWSPDGQQVAYINEESGYPQLMVYNLHTKHAERLTNNYRTHVGPTWSPDGRSITFVSDLDERWNTKIYTLDLPSRTVTPIRVGSATDPIWSPDGRYLLYLGGIEKVNFYLWERTTEQSILLYEGNFITNDTPGWSADSQHIVYAAFLTAGDTGIFELDVEECMAAPATCTPRLLTTVPAFYRTPRWKP